MHINKYQCLAIGTKLSELHAFMISPAIILQSLSRLTT